MWTTPESHHVFEGIKVLNEQKILPHALLAKVRVFIYDSWPLRSRSEMFPDVGVE